MKHFTLTVFLSFILSQVLIAQTPQQIADYFDKHPEADTNNDGTLTREEARAHRRMSRDPSSGDNAPSRSAIRGAQISLTESPIEEVALQSEDDVDLTFVYRKPVGEGPFPTIIFFHGGGSTTDQRTLQNNLRSGAIQTRFLEKDYLTVASTRRPYWASRQKERPHGFYDAVKDTKAIIKKVSTLPGVDPENIILYGGSGGGILAIVSAAGSDIAAVIAGEPATVIPLDPKTGQTATPRDYESIMEDPLSKYTAERKAEMQSWMKEITCPILLLQGNHVDLYKSNFELLIPEMQKLGKDITAIEYPGLSHGFYWGTPRTGATEETVEKVITDSLEFLRKAQ
ncbi:MAG: hypothetical protein CMO55_05515 [Verrucomicrobiales bacterium]|nr:hypothetical protein [Verrucomicrobiales bacterium]